MDNYTVVISNDLYKFKKECDSLIVNSNYIPAGGIFIKDEHGVSFFYQAFYKKEIK